MSIFGWDMSHYDAPNPSTAPSQGIEFITHKAGGDSQSGDPEIGTWWSYVRTYSTDVMLGAYWVLLGGDSPISSADAFLTKLDAKCPSWRDRDSFILQVDCEEWNGDPDTVPTLAQINAFCDRLMDRTDGAYQPIAYAPKWVYGSVSGLRYPVWASSYVSGSGSFRSLYPGDDSSHWGGYGKAITILQYSSNATIGGQGTSDANAYRGTLDQLKHLLSPGKMANIVTSPVDLTSASVTAVANATASAVTAKSLGSSGPTVGVALQTGAYGNTNELIEKVDALVEAVAALAAPTVDVDALAAAIVSGLVAAGVGGVTEAQLIDALNSIEITATAG